jgi:hypothetical protein
MHDLGAVQRLPRRSREWLGIAPSGLGPFEVLHP